MARNAELCNYNSGMRLEGDIEDSITGVINNVILFQNDTWLMACKSGVAEMNWLTGTLSSIISLKGPKLFIKFQWLYFGVSGVHLEWFLIKIQEKNIFNNHASKYRNSSKLNLFFVKLKILRSPRSLKPADNET